ncbi:MAG: FMN-binding protein [Clostridia bacterium]|nr:FMN-binding protein [Clostridia bacterium]
MRRIISLLTCIAAAACMTACTASADQRTGEAQGYGGLLRVTVSMNGSDITAVNVVEHHETDGVGTRAIDALPNAIVQADSVDVDSVSGATITSEAIKAAVSSAIGLEGMIMDMIPAPDADNAVPAAMDGVGMAATGRIGPGTDANGNQVYAFNVVFAHASFDQEGRILSLAVDQMEVASPNLGGGASVFSGFPGGDVTEDSFMSEIAAWTTKGAQGDRYMLGSGSWRSQMDAYEQMMTGKTIDEVNDWFSQYFSAETGKPLSSGAAFDSLSDTDRTALTDMTSRATMSLRGEHGNILLAIQRAWEDAQRNSSGSGDTASPGSTDGTMVDTNTPTNMTDSEATMG